ncbi:Uncharacterized protein PBTT_07171 [Plasmodiophora brassicae]|uniref:Uncharacterized protein n=1 Tax=Plasmodiophora brassicae TaxID=37360 RepID=A0A3P3YHH6_PLABS|nr:unnamed protein product [Plasmodiophora brassicae]
MDDQDLSTVAAVDRLEQLVGDEKQAYQDLYSEVRELDNLAGEPPMPSVSSPFEQYLPPSGEGTVAEAGSQPQYRREKHDPTSVAARDQKTARLLARTKEEVALLRRQVDRMAQNNELAKLEERMREQGSRFVTQVGCERRRAVVCTSVCAGTLARLSAHIDQLISMRPPQ